MNWNISFLLISGVLIQLLGETQAVCNHPATVSTCKTNVGIEIHQAICFLKKTYTNGGITYERGGTNETECMKNAALSSLRNPDCKSPHPSVNTVCYDCCTSHCPENRFCNQVNDINPNLMPSYMQTGGSGHHTTAAPITSKPTTPTTIPTTTTPTPTTTRTTPTTTPTTTTTTAPTATPTTTTVPTTTPTTAPTTTPTKLASTTPTPTTLPTTPSTITTVTTIASTTPTTVITTSAAVNGTKCLVCTEDQSTFCSSMDYTVCSGDRPYCLNEIVYQNDNWTKTLHRCASRVECYWDYWIGTGNGTECIQNGVCTYCCQGPDGKPCNARTEKPTNLTNFGQTQNRAYKCAVTGPQNSNTIQDCSPSERFCLNDVYYDTDPNTNNLITRDVRRCASQEQCKGKWLQSRKTDACLTGNMTGVDASKTGNRLLCHYCCESNATTPCNLHPKPDQIKLFIQPTTIPIVSTSLPVVSTSLPAVSSTFLTNATTIMTTNATTIMTTNATTIMTTNSTTISTTAVTTTPTTPKAKVYCHQCGDTSNGIPCSSRQVTTSQPKECNGAYQYCMTDIIQDSNGNADVYKRCVTDHICRKEWIVESADEDYCKRYGVVTNPSAFNCHFCCTSDGCNSGLVPNSTTWYKLHN